MRDYGTLAECAIRRRRRRSGAFRALHGVLGASLAGRYRKRDDRQFDASVPPELQDHQRAPRLVDGFWRPQFQDTPAGQTTVVAFIGDERNGVFFNPQRTTTKTPRTTRRSREAAPAWEPPRPCRLRRAP